MFVTGNARGPNGNLSSIPLKSEFYFCKPVEPKITVTDGQYYCQRCAEYTWQESAGRELRSSCRRSTHAVLQHLIETTIRYRIWDSTYWKEHCFALTAESVIDRALELHYVGGTYANTRPTEFLCLALKLLQLQPEKEIILEYMRADEFKQVSE